MLVSSMEELSLRCRSVESLSKAIYKSLLDLNEKAETIDEELKSLLSLKKEDSNRRSSLYIQVKKPFLVEYCDSSC